MTKKEWAKTIKKACEDAQTYKPYFDSVIDTLAQILETRDTVHEQFIEEGSQPTVIMTTDRGNKENVHKNPLITLENEMNALALKYWCELGLTSVSFKKLKVQVDDGGSLEKLLQKISG